MNLLIGEPVILLLLPVFVLVTRKSLRICSAYFLVTGTLCAFGIARPYVSWTNDVSSPEPNTEPTFRLQPETTPEVSVTVLRNCLYIGDTLDVTVNMPRGVDADVSAHIGDTQLVSETISSAEVPVQKIIRRRWDTVGISELLVSARIEHRTFLKRVALLGLGKRKALMVAHDFDEARILEEILENDGFSVVKVSPTKLSAEILNDDVSCLVLYDTPNVFRQDQANAMSRYVHEGGGLVVISGPKLFSVGAYADSPIGELLPVKPEIPKQIERYRVALGLILDTSGSMAEADGEIRKIDMAREAAVAAALELKAGKDELGILAFAGDAAWISVFEQVNTVAIRSRLNRIQPGGETDLMKAMTKMRLAMEASTARVRHVLVLTDGFTAGDIEAYGGMAKRFADSGVTVSTVGLGVGHRTELLRQIATAGGGKFYAVQRPAELVTVFTQDTQQHTRSGLIEEPLVTLPRETSEWSHVNFKNLPPLLGMVAATSRPEATVHLESPNGLPLLVSCQRGLGRVFFFA